MNNLFSGTTSEVKTFANDFIYNFGFLYAYQHLGIEGHLMKVTDTQMMRTGKMAGLWAASDLFKDFMIARGVSLSIFT